LLALHISLRPHHVTWIARLPPIARDHHIRKTKVNAYDCINPLHWSRRRYPIIIQYRGKVFACCRFGDRDRFYAPFDDTWFEEVLDLPHGIPCEDPFRRGLSRWALDALTPCFIAWSEALSDLSKGDIVSIDGKTLRHAFDHAASTAAMHMVSAWAHANRLVLEQLTVDAKSHEITAIPKLLPL
jgi:hypothetical protein